MKTTITLLPEDADILKAAKDAEEATKRIRKAVENDIKSALGTCVPEGYYLSSVQFTDDGVAILTSFPNTDKATDKQDYDGVEADVETL